ncbi:nucleotidyltransferase family protein [Falsiroseomonas sp.]|uniref:nucleotidyltransferase family protein n=1 Tax=Falsiroseomonas sp. TaxID=2870721 RepID=UPI003F702DF3
MSTARVAAILTASPAHRDALQALALAGPRGAWIGAGFVRNAVWDALTGRTPETASLADIDVVHWDDATPDAAFEAALRHARPALPWSVTHQAGMAAANGHAPYRDVADALAHWPETATAVAARLVAGRVEVLAPLRLDDLMDLVVRPGPAHAAQPSVVRARLRAKAWPRRWPALRVFGLAGD